MNKKMGNVTDKGVVWRTYPDYPFIEVNQFGEIRTKDRYVSGRNGSKRLIKGRVLKQQLLPSGYMQVKFHVNYKLVSLYVHRIVATCFLPNLNNCPEVNHRDNDPTNNRWDNLEWCTPEYNIAYREKHGKALNHPMIAINLDNFEVLWFESQREAARQLSINAGNINSVIKGGRPKTAGGYWFCDADEKAVEKIRDKFGDDIAEKVERLMNKNNYLNKC